MKKIIQILGGNSFALFVFVLLLSFLNWPILSSLDNLSSGGAYLCIYAVWLTIALLALIVGLSFEGPPPSGKGKKEGEGKNV
ncbi:hypothetical protein M0R36_05375 [bacterium]|jgi:Kef-type K+ transport system membrane component KefB|nr:hypothetical protein [bacterium]